MPGPGSYNLQTDFEREKSFSKVQGGAFGTSEIRFIEKK